MTPFRRRISPRGLAVTEDGTAVVPAYFLNRGSVLVRFTADGLRDATFGDYGVARLSVGDNSRLHAAALQDDQKIVAAGWSDGQPLVVRYEGGPWDGVEACIIE